MSNIGLLPVIILTSIFTETTAQVVCVNPAEIAELRVVKSRKCVNIEGTSGRGNVDTNLCDGYHDQQLIMCEDGTIRNQGSPHYCISPSESGKGNVESVPCEVYPAIPDYQKWRYGRSKYFVDGGGIQQAAREILNVKSGECMNVAGYDGNGDIDTYRCENLDDQYFYFRSRGKLQGHGRLQVEISRLCLDVEGTEGRGNVYIDDCKDAADQYFDYYENGELVNKKSGICVNIAGYDGKGDIDTQPCEDLTDQMWRQPQQYCHGDYCSFVSKKSGQCLNVAGYDAKKGSNVDSYKCETAPDQRFRWVTQKWVTPTATWTMVGCNQNGDVSHKISNTINYRIAISESITISVSSTIEGGVEFPGGSASASVTTELSTSLAKEWENSQSGTKEIDFSCKSYDSGQLFKGGCMWQLRVTTKEATKNDYLAWSPQIVKCTSSNKMPTCPPFTKCKDETCTMCEGAPGVRKRRSVEGSLVWKKVLKMG